MEQNVQDHKDIKLDIKEVKDNIGKINDKLDSALTCKADKTDVEQMRQNQWGLLVGVLLSAMGVIFSLIKSGVIK